VSYGGPLQLVPLDPKASDHLHGRLGDGKTLAARLLSTHTLGAWSAFALVSPGLSEDKLYRFTESGAVPRVPPEQWQHVSGGDLAQPVVSTNEQLVAALSARLRSTPSGFLTVEDPMGQASDPWLARSELRPWLLGNEVYFAADGTSFERLAEVVSNGGGAWPGLLAVVCSQLPASFVDWHKDLNLDESDVMTMAESASEIWVGAYDNESYLLWTPSEAIAHQYRKLLETDVSAT